MCGKLWIKLKCLGIMLTKSGLGVNVGYQFDISGRARDKPLHSCGRDLIVLVRRRPTLPICGTIKSN